MSEVRRRDGGRAVLSWTALAVTRALGLWVLVTATRELRAEGPSAAAQQTTRQWAEGSAPAPSRAEWAAVRTTLLQAQAVREASPVLQELLGNLHMVGAVQEWASPAERSAWLADAQRHYRRSLQLRPADGLTWALLAGALARSADRGSDFAQALGQALTLGPNENHVQLQVMRLMLEFWDDVPPSLQDWATGLYDAGTTSQRQAINAMAAPYGLSFSTAVPPRGN